MQVRIALARWTLPAPAPAGYLPPDLEVASTQTAHLPASPSIRAHTVPCRSTLPRPRTVPTPTPLHLDPHLVEAAAAETVDANRAPTAEEALQPMEVLRPQAVVTGGHLVAGPSQQATTMVDAVDLHGLLAVVTTNVRRLRAALAQVAILAAVILTSSSRSALRSKR